MSTKPIPLSGHARSNLAFRGTTEEEITETILSIFKVAPACSLENEPSIRGNGRCDSS